MAKTFGPQHPKHPREETKATNSKRHPLIEEGQEQGDDEDEEQSGHTACGCKHGLAGTCATFARLESCLGAPLRKDVCLAVVCNALRGEDH
ncbi:hypothetical protein BHE90_011972, partial [Fusarium euwallaceae]